MRPFVKDRSAFTGHVTMLLLLLFALWLFPALGFAQVAITCPTSAIDYCANQAGQICVDLPVQGADSVTVVGDPSAHWSVGKLCFNATTPGAYPFTVTAYDSQGSQSCNVTVNVGFGQPPTIICPTEPTRINLCSPGEVCLVMATRGVGQISAAGATFANGNMCFQADTSGVYRFVAVVSNACGADTCHVEVQVTVGRLPVITCPVETTKFSLCAPEKLCVAVPVQGADTVEVSGGATWSDGLLCFVPDSAGLYEFHVATANACGKATCNVQVDVSFVPKPVVICPSELPPYNTCGAEKICVPVTVQNADSIVTNFGTFENGTVCFTADSSGLYQIKLAATNRCGGDSCAFSVNVTRRELPIIACPTEPFLATTCTNTVCVPLLLKTQFADSVVAEGATLTDDNLCFGVTESGLHRIPLKAYGPCGATACTVEVSVTIAPQTEITCVDSTLKFTVCGAGSVCFGLPIAHADSVFVTGGTWDAKNQRICFAATNESEYDLTVVAKGVCNTDTCHVHAVVNFVPVPVIACPQQPLTGRVCKAGPVCVDLPIASATEVTVPGALWKNDQLCFQADSTGSYIFDVTASNSCHSAACTVSVHVEIAAALHACFGNEYGGKPLTVKFSNCTTPSGSFQYEWSFGDGVVSTEFAPVHSYTRSGCYPVTLAVLGFCGVDTLRSSVVDTLCVQDSSLVTPTDQWISVYCSTPTIDGIALKPGDMIAAYDPQGVLCGLDSVKADGAFGFMPIYRDDQFSPIDEGANPGDTIAFSINGKKVFTQPPVTWTANGDRLQVCAFLSELCTDLVLNQGWNLVSWNVPLSGDISSVFGDQMSCIDLILSYDRGGLTFDPDMTKFSTLSTVDYSHGYWIKVKPGCTITLKLCGAKIVSGSIPIYKGWNLVSYWPTASLTPEDALASLSGLAGAWSFYNGAPKVYIPGMSLYSTLDTMRTYFGYWVKSTAVGSLVYPGFGQPGVVASVPADEQKATIAPSRDWISLYGEGITLDGRPLADGSIIAAYTADGTVCGSGHYVDGLLKFTPVYGRDDADAATKLYAAAGDDLTIYVDGVRTSLSVKWEASSSLVRLSALTTAKGATGQIPKAFSLSQNYPNPFNPTTTIEYALPVASTVKIEVFNIAGQRVATLVDGSVEAGNHSAVWDGSDANGSSVASGIYFYRLRAGTYSETRKMIMLK